MFSGVQWVQSAMAAWLLGMSEQFTDWLIKLLTFDHSLSLSNDALKIITTATMGGVVVHHCISEGDANRPVAGEKDRLNLFS